MRKYIACAAAPMLFTAACGGDPFSGLEHEDDFGPQRQGASSEAGGTQAVSGTLGLAGIVGTSEVNESSLGTMSQLSVVPLQIVSDAFFDEAQLRLPNAPRAAATMRPEIGDGGVSWAAFPDCVEDDDGFVRFRDCEVSTGESTTALDGLIEVDGERLVADLDTHVTVEFDGNTQKIATNLAADLLIDEARIEGRVDSRTSATMSGVGSSRQTAALILDVEIESDCATGGEVRAGVEQTASAGGQTQTLRAIGRVEFGPECGDVTVYARLD